MKKLSDDDLKTLRRSSQQSSYQAHHDGRCGIRLVVGNGSIALATTAMSSSLSFAERDDAARRITALWNAMLTVPTEMIEEQARKRLRQK